MHRFLLLVSGAHGFSRTTSIFATAYSSGCGQDTNASLSEVQPDLPAATKAPCSASSAKSKSPGTRMSVAKTRRESER